MVFGTIGTLIDKIKELVVEYLNGIAHQFNDTIDDIRGDIDKVSKKLDEVKSAVGANDIGGEIQTLKDGVENIKSGISDGVQGEITAVNNTLTSRFDAVDNSLVTVNNRFDTVDIQLATLTANVNKLVGEQIAEMESLRAEAAKVEILGNTVAEKDKQINELNANLTIAQDKYSNLSKELQDMDGKVTAAQDELNAERQSFAADKDALQKWRDAVADYAPVRDAMKNCNTFKDFLEKRNLTDETEIGLFAFVQELGKTTDFLRDIHQTAVDAKKTQLPNAVVMTAEELAVYEALNKCYRRIWNIDFDVFVTPGERKPIGDDFYKIPFNKDDSIVLKDPRQRSLKFVKGIYVPLLLTREGKMYKQSYVEASNI